MKAVERNSGKAGLGLEQVNVALMVLTILWLGLFSSSVSSAAFNDVTQEVGVQFHQESESEIFIGAGAVWVDLDNNGYDDLYATQANGCNRLFLNNGSGGFETVSQAAGADDCAGISHGATAADYDNDGDQDLFITSNGRNSLFQNRLAETGQLSFVDVTEASGMGGDGAYNSSSATWADYDGDGLLDLFVGNHVTTSVPQLECAPDDLWHNQGNGLFVNLANPLGIATGGAAGKPGCALAATWSDYDGDSDQDLLVINDHGAEHVPNRLFRNDGPSESDGWTFTDVSDETGFNFQMFGMGIAISDVDYDGRFDYYMSDAGANILALNSENAVFTDVAREAGVEASDQEVYGGPGLISWGSAFFDANMDGYDDLVVANGGAPQDKFPGVFGDDYVNLNPNYFYRRRHNDMSFMELHHEVGMRVEKYNRSVALSDYDGDGDMDVYIGNLQGLNTLYRNDVPTSGHWLKVKLEGTIGNRDAIGARIVASGGGRTWIREVGGSSFLSRHSLTSHFGLGQVALLDQLEVIFPSGLSFEMRDMNTDRIVEVREPVSTISGVVGADLNHRGETIELEMTATNQQDTVFSSQIWLDVVFPSGVKRTLWKPHSVVLQPGEVATHSLSFVTDQSTPLGAYTLIPRLGSHPADVVHQDFVQLMVVE